VRYLDAQRVAVVMVLKITGIRAPVEHYPVLVGYRQQFL